MTTGSKTALSISSICDSIKNGGSIGGEDVRTASITATCGQTTARRMLQEMNVRRSGSNGTAPWCWNQDDSEKVEYSGLNELIYDYDLEKIATQRAAELALSYAHRRPDGKDCYSAYTEASYSCNTSGENIALGQRTWSEVLDAWWEENESYDGQGHRRNILNRDFTAVGIGHVVVDGTHYWVQEFSDTVNSTDYIEPNDSDTKFDIAFDTSKIVSDVLSASKSSLSINVSYADELPEITERLLLDDTYSNDGVAIENTLNWYVRDVSIAYITNGFVAGNAVGQTEIVHPAMYGGDPIEIPAASV